MNPLTLSGHSLRTQIAWVFGALVAALAILLSVGFGDMLKRRIEQDAGSALQVVADNASTLLANGLYERSREVQVMAASSAVWAQGLDSVEVIHLLARSQAMQPNNVWIGVADTEGVVRAATGNLLVGQSVKDHAWFQAGKQDVYVGDVRPARLLSGLLPPTATGEAHRFVDFSAPIRIGPTTVGVLGIYGNWNWAREVVQNLVPTDGPARELEVFIFDKAGAPLHARGRQAAQLGGLRMPQGLVVTRAETSAPRTAVVAWNDGERYLTAVTPLRPRNAASDLGWQIVARMPVRIAFADADLAVQKTLLVGLAAALLASALAWLAARRLSEDLFALARGAANLEAGQPGATIPLASSSREVHRLSVVLSGMTRRLLAANEAMEDKVRQRTQELEAANRELETQARSDPLTGLLNRRGFSSQLDFALALARRGRRPLAMVALDVDHFKRINDTHGHDAGDQVLQRLASALRERLRDSDVVARLGGEEFVALLPDTDLAGAEAMARALVQTIAAQEDPVVGRFTVSAGVSALRNHLDNGPALLRRSDQALYEAKGQGRNRVCVQA